MKTVAVLGSTGSIGTQTLDVLTTARDRFRVHALSASRSVDVVAGQARAWHPAVVVMGDVAAADAVRAQVPADIRVTHGDAALAEAAAGADITVNGVVGFAGLTVTLAALTAGRRLALANKESLIAAGPVVAAALRTPGAELIPVDSEHCALHQCLRSEGPTRSVARLLLTASGGPFRGRRRADLARVSVKDALAHPTWQMGPKITVDSSTLMNKGLEVIEAHELFGIDYDRIDVVVHPQSIVHSMVEFSDGSTIAQLSLPDMRLPIGYALAYPERLPTPFGRIDWSALARLDFEAPDRESFPCLGLAYEAGRRGGTAPAWLNAANEVVVEAFLGERIGWITISEVLESVLGRHDGAAADSLAAVLDGDAHARGLAGEFVARAAA